MAALNPPKTSPLGIGLAAGSLLAGFFVLWWCQRVPGVAVVVDPEPTHLGPEATLSLTAEAQRGGLRWVELRLVQADSVVVARREEYPAAETQKRRLLQWEVDVEDLGLTEGPARLEVHARDGFWRPLGVGDAPAWSVDVTLDFTPPSLEVATVTRYLSQGGAGIAVLRCEETASAAVSVGDTLFPAFAATNGDARRRVALFPLAFDLPADAPVLAVATDPAGNRTRRELPVSIKRVQYAQGTVQLREDFLRRTIADLLPEETIDTQEQLSDAFVVLNRDLRAEAAATKRRLARSTHGQMLWRGAFVQPRNTKVFSNFAETRDYSYGGKNLDRQVHLGFDLASTRHAPVPAANRGIVIYAAPLNIYGNTVVVDHGLGLQTLYAHLSSIEATVGDTVDQGQVLGRTGTTGLAVGDHLHYEVLVHGVPVSPLQWWDPDWIRDKIAGPLLDAGLSFAATP